MNTSNVHLLLLSLTFLMHAGCSQRAWYLNSYFEFDVLVQRKTSSDKYVVPYAGTDCKIWLKHGNNPALSMDGVRDVNYYSVHQSEQLTRLYFPSNYEVSLSQETLFWTTCDDGLLLDYMRLVAPDGSRSTWGQDNQYAWCLSTDVNDGNIFNRLSQNEGDWNTILTSFTDYYGKNCAQTWRLQSGGRVDGWVGWSPSTGRRVLEDDVQAEMLALPTTADVQACVEDEDETEEDCARLVDQILEFEINHPEGWLPMTPLPIEATADSEEQQEGTSNEEQQEVTSDQEQQEGSSSEEQQEVTSQDGRRRLFDLLQRFQ